MGRVYNYTGMLPFALSGQILHNIIHYFCPIKKIIKKEYKKNNKKIISIQLILFIIAYDSVCLSAAFRLLQLFCELVCN